MYKRQKQSYYITQKAFAPVFQNTYTKLLTPGEQKWEYLLQELRKARQYIFLEYFIIQDGIMWQSVLDILKQKVSEGVTVKLLYDDLGCIQTLPDNFREQMESLGLSLIHISGNKDLPDRANVLRAYLLEESDRQDSDEVVLLETNIDDQTGEQLAYACGLLRDSGALDAVSYTHLDVYKRQGLHSGKN